ncbi:MAG TPA: DsbA family oxidoreductase [Rhizomicrobium sp.]|jgi:predicted DsbA family dithiol-disulfide isomerase|nr:DsbA family oxidoreductase [Rhizomicrobium sp.]
MQIDVISDTVCPWCFIGKRRLARAMAMRPAIAFDVRWRPFRLDATVPKGGLDRRTYLEAKFGGAPNIAAIDKQIAAEGEKEGIEFAFDAIARRPDTIDSHRLIRWAEAAGVQDEMVERLFIAYFENGEDIEDIRVLSDIADLVGMDGVGIAELLEGDTDRALVEREDLLAHEMGVTGVPAFIFGGKLALSGAREPDVMAAVIDRVIEMGAGLPQDEPEETREEG